MIDTLRRLFPVGSDLTVWLLWLLPAALLVVVAVVYLRRQGSRRRLKQRIADLEALSEAGRELVESELDIEALCALIADKAGKIINNESFQVGLFDGNVYRILYWRIRGVRRPTPANFDLTERPTLVGWIREQRQPVVINHFSQEVDRLPVKPRQVTDDPVQSALFLPLVSGDQVLGILGAQHPDPYRFKAEDIGRLSILANQAAAAVANYLLYEQAKTRAEDLEMVNYIGRQVNRLQRLDEIFREVVRLTRDRLGFHPINIMGIDTQTGEAVMQASSVVGVEPGTIRLLPGQGLIGTALAQRQTVLVQSVADDPRYLASIGLAAYDAESTGTKAEIAIPLLVDEEVVGVLDVQSTSVGGFSAREQAVLEALANEVASAIHKTRQLAIQREQAWVTTAQLQVADAISHSTSAEELLDGVARLTTLLAGAEQCAVLLWDEEIGAYVGKALHGGSAETRQRFQDMVIAIGHWSALDAVHIGHARVNTHRPPPWRHRRDTTLSTLYPLLARGRLYGVLVVRPPAAPAGASGVLSPGGAANRRDELLRSIVAQTAQALENNRLQMAQQEEAWVNTALLQVAEAVNSDIDLNRILDTIVRLVPMLVGVKSCLILFWDEDEQRLRGGPSYGLSEMGLGLIETTDFGLDEFPAIVVQDEELLSPQSTVYRISLPQWLSTVFETESADAIPLRARAGLVGILFVGPPCNNRPLTGRRLNILTGIAQQAATAVVNNQLYQESAERDRLEQELNVARAIQASLIPQASPTAPHTDIAAYWRAARQVSGDFYDFLPLGDDRLAIIIADVADKGVPAALFMALSRTIIRSVAFSRITPADTLERANEIIYGDTASDLFVTVFYALWQPSTRTLTYANGGHNPPLLRKADGTLRPLAGDGIALGILERITLRQQQLQLEPGDAVIFYTDGVTEAINEGYAEFGLGRLQQAIRSGARDSADDIVSAITTAVRDHVGNTPQFDDITIVILRVTDG